MPIALSTGQPIGGRGTVFFMPEKERTPFGRRLFEARTHAKLSQPALAKAVGLSQSTIGELEWKGSGSQKITEIAMTCGVRAEWLASGKGAMVEAPAKLTPELAEIAKVFDKLKGYQVEWAMESIRAILHGAPHIGPPKEADSPEAEKVQEYSSAERRIR